MEAMVSRRAEPYRDSIGYTKGYEDLVSVWTSDGHFQMPYVLFERLFGIKLPTWTERQMVVLSTEKTLTK